MSVVAIPTEDDPDVRAGLAGARPRPRPRTGTAAAVSDDALVAAAQRDQEWAWAALVERYRGLVYSIASLYGMSRDDTAEVSQAVWLRLLENIHQIRDRERIAGWIRTVAANECRGRYRQRGREVLGVDVAAMVCQPDIASDGLLADERADALRRALSRIHGKGRDLLQSQLAEPDVTYGELAAKHDLARGSVGPTRIRCLSQLRGAPELSGLASKR